MTLFPGITVLFVYWYSMDPPVLNMITGKKESLAHSYKKNAVSWFSAGIELIFFLAAALVLC